MAMRAVHKRYLREFIPAMIGYVVLIFVSVFWLKTLQGTVPRAVVTLLPSVPIVFAVRAMGRVIRDQDELERRIDLESIAFAGAVCCFGFLSYGFLLNARVLDAPPAASVAMWVLPVFMGIFGVTKCIMRLRYRSHG